MKSNDYTLWTFTLFKMEQQHQIKKNEWNKLEKKHAHTTSWAFKKFPCPLDVNIQRMCHTS